MMKFRCQSCGHRIAVPPRMMGRLVNCPECGGVTHPLAEQLVAGGRPAAEPDKAPAPPATAAAHQVRHCDNCGRLIGRLELSHVWQGNLVCVTCHANLPHAAGAPAGKVAAAVEGKVAKPVASRAEAQVVNARRLVPSPSRGGAATPMAASPSRASLFLATRPARVLLALCTLGLAIYFVYSFVQVVGLLTNLVVVGVLLIVALFFLFRPGPRPAGEGGGPDDTPLARRP